MNKEEFRQMAALEILCALRDRIELPEIKIERMIRSQKLEIHPQLYIDNVKRDAACFAAVQYADRLIGFLEGTTEYKLIERKKNENKEI